MSGKQVRSVPVRWMRFLRTAEWQGIHPGGNHGTDGPRLSLSGCE